MNLGIKALALFGVLIKAKSKNDFIEMFGFMHYAFTKRQRACIQSVAQFGNLFVNILKYKTLNCF